MILDGPIAAIYSVLCPRCMCLHVECRCDRVALRGQTDAQHDGVYRQVPLGWRSPKVGNRHERRKRAAEARRRGR